MADFNPKANVIMVDYWEKDKFPERRSLTRQAIESIQQFYPDFHFILVTDYPKEEEINPVRDLENIEIVFVPDLGNYPEMKRGISRSGEGLGIGFDEGVKHVTSDHFFAAHQDILMIKRGYPERIVDLLRDNVKAVGPGYSNRGNNVFQDRNFIASHFSVFSLEPIRRFHLSFSQIYFPAFILATTQFLCYRLLSTGFEYQTINLDEFRKYIIHTGFQFITDIDRIEKEVQGQTDREELQFLATFAKEVLENGVIVNIGTCEGSSAFVLAAASESSVKVYTIDPKISPIFIEKRKLLRLEERVISLDGRSQEFYRGWKEPIDLIFVDGDHSYGAVKEDVEGWCPLVKKGGFCLFHDYNRITTVKRAVDEAENRIFKKIGKCKLVYAGQRL